MKVLISIGLEWSTKWSARLMSGGQSDGIETAYTVGTGAAATTAAKTTFTKGTEIVNEIINEKDK